MNQLLKPPMGGLYHHGPTCQVSTNLATDRRPGLKAIPSRPGHFCSWVAHSFANPRSGAALASVFSHWVIRCLFLVILLSPETTVARTAAVSTIQESQLRDFSKNPKPVQELIRAALALTRQNLTYTFGSANPNRGGMDCSGTVHYLLQNLGYYGAPRQSDEICKWVMTGSYHRTIGVSELTDRAFASLRPGDLLFWTGTYATGERVLPISHVMMFLGWKVTDGTPVIFGSTDGRRYAGQTRCGVSVFDLRLPKADSKASFHGYGSIPGLGKKAASPIQEVKPSLLNRIFKK